MKILICYFSGTGNTKRVVDKFAECLKENGNDVTLQRVEHEFNLNIPRYVDTFEEEEQILEYAVKKAAGRIFLIAGSGSNCTQTAVERSAAYSQTGVDALLVITPYYNRTNTSGMIKHFTQIADVSKVPIILYNVPGRTGCNISEEAVAGLTREKKRNTVTWTTV